MKTNKFCSPAVLRGLAVLLLLGFAVLTIALVTAADAQESAPRKLVTRVMPVYPEYLRQHDIGGSVRLSVVVTPSGNVKSVTPVGGNPILVDAAIAAVKQWKYASGENTDTFEVRVDFNPPQH